MKLAANVSSLSTHLFLEFIALNYRIRPGLKNSLKSKDGWINFSIGIRTKDASVDKAVQFENGNIRVLPRIPAQVDGQIILEDESVLKEVATSVPSELMKMVMTNRVVMQGDLSYILLFNFVVSQVLYKMHVHMLEKARLANSPSASSAGENGAAAPRKVLAQLKANEAFNGAKDKPGKDPGVKYLRDPYLPELGIHDFPRLKDFLDIHFNVKPAVCHERPQLLTDWYRTHGFEVDAQGKPWSPELRQAQAFHHLMTHRQPIIRKNDLLAGTTTTKEIGVVLYPDSHAAMLWGELLTAPYRALNPYDIDEDTIQILHNEVFPFWIHRNFRQWVREQHQNPLCQQLDDRFAVYFLWKTVALSHTIIDYPKLLNQGVNGIIAEIDARLAAVPAGDTETRVTLQAMKLTLEGVNVYAAHLAQQAAQEARLATDPIRQQELSALAQALANAPANPCTTLLEAVNAMWVLWVAVHMENTNAGFSMGRLDQWLQPYFEADMAKLSTEAERAAYIKYAVELVGCLYMRCTDHLPMVPDIGNYLFGGSSSDQAITLGGVTPEGEDAVNDMTYIFLKVTEMLAIRDPNVNARYHAGKNSPTYLKRLCEVNLNTTATPSIHNDMAVMDSLQEFNYPLEHLRDWSATGCVEPTLSGKHMGHTNSMMFNMVAALEMALNNGEHPLMQWKVGPETGAIQEGAFPTFDSFFDAYCRQFQFLADNACEYNNLLGEAHQVIRPTPFLSSVMEGCIATGRDVTHGGALYNTSGTAMIGLADVTDSLLVIKKLVFDEKSVSFEELAQAVRTNFAQHPALLARIKTRVPLFGSGNAESVAMANKVTQFAHDCFINQTNYRGGQYTVGFWSMSNHVAFGSLTGALPSGRLSGKAFTPGLTPEAHASKSILDNLRDVSSLKAENMNNNIAFNVKIVPDSHETHQQSVDHIYSYAKTFCEIGGMQMQFNVVSSATLRDAMAHPENYQNLLVRISGYNAYFVTLNRDMQIELIERSEFGA